MHEGIIILAAIIAAGKERAVLMTVYKKVLRALGGVGIAHAGATDFSPSLIFPRSRGLKRVPANCRSIIVCVFPYFTGEFPDRNVSLYAVSEDYHDILKKYLSDGCAALSDLFPGFSFVPFADSSPVSEVRAAASAGLGVIGFNGTLITREYGSYVFIGEILTDLPVERVGAPAGICDMCGECAAACPGGAISAGGVCTSKCASAISQKKGEFSEEERRIFLSCGLVWGCDICQQVCPLNRNVAKTYIPEFYENPRPVISPENAFEDFDRRAYSWRGKEVIKRNLALKNSPPPNE